MRKYSKMQISRVAIFVLAVVFLQSMAEGLDAEQQKLCRKFSRRHLKTMMKSFTQCSTKLKFSVEEYQNKMGCIVKCVMQTVNVLDENDMITEANLKASIESHIPPEFVQFAHESLNKCIKEHTLDPKDENCKSYLDMGTCMQTAEAEMCGGDLPML